MHLLDLSLPTPQENLALDEALLECAESGEVEPTLRFWESSVHFVALGYTNRLAVETNTRACRELNVPILRRVTGGGTVLQGPGCLNYALVGRIEAGAHLDVGATNEWVMNAVRDALNPLLNGQVELNGHTDLTWRGRKFSGNAQKRKARHFLFHGTVLLDFDLELIARTLQTPPKEPAYRAGRKHLEFVTNVPLDRESVKAALAQTFRAREEVAQWPQEKVEALVQERYTRAEWNEKF